MDPGPCSRFHNPQQALRGEHLLLQSLASLQELLSFGRVNFVGTQHQISKQNPGLDNLNAEWRSCMTQSISDSST